MEFLNLMVQNYNDITETELYWIKQAYFIQLGITIIIFFTIYMTLCVLMFMTIIGIPGAIALLVCINEIIKIVATINIAVFAGWTYPLLYLSRYFNDTEMYPYDKYDDLLWKIERYKI